MTHGRTHWLPIMLIVTAAAGVVLAGIALSGFAGAPNGDLLVSSRAGTTNLLVGLGAALFLGLDAAHLRRRHGRTQRVEEPTRH